MKLFTGSSASVYLINMYFKLIVLLGTYSVIVLCEENVNDPNGKPNVYY